MSDSYRIGEIARQAGVSVETIRYYERIRVLAPAPRTGRGIRRYPPTAIERIRFVKQAQQHGLTLGEIRELIRLKQRGGGRCHQVHQLLAAKLVRLDEQRAQLDDFRRTLQALTDQCEASLRADPDPECPIIAKI